MLPSATIFILPQEINASLGIFLKEWCTIGHFQDTMMNDSDISFCEKIITGQLFWCTCKNNMSPILPLFWTGVSLEWARGPPLFLGKWACLKKLLLILCSNLLAQLGLKPYIFKGWPCIWTHFNFEFEKDVIEIYV